MEEKLNGNLGRWSFEPISRDIRIKDIVSDIRIKTKYLGHFSINNLKGAINDIGMYKAFPRESLPNFTPHHFECLSHFSRMEGSIPKILLPGLQIQGTTENKSQMTFKYEPVDAPQYNLIQQTVYTQTVKATELLRI